MSAPHVIRCPHDGGYCHHKCGAGEECYRLVTGGALTTPWPGFPKPGRTPVPCDDETEPYLGTPDLERVMRDTATPDRAAAPHSNTERSQLAVRSYTRGFEKGYNQGTRHGFVSGVGAGVVLALMIGLTMAVVLSFNHWSVIR